MAKNAEERSTDSHRFTTIFSDNLCEKSVEISGPFS